MKRTRPLKTTNYYVDHEGDLRLSKRGQLWTIGVNTGGGHIVEFEMPAKVACSVREFLDEARCPECETPQPTTSPQNAETEQ